jgi:hypothetical protein
MVAVILPLDFAFSLRSDFVGRARGFDVGTWAEHLNIHSWVNFEPTREKAGSSSWNY